MENFLDKAKKLVEAKMLLDTFEIPKRPITLSAHQYKKKLGTNQGYSQYKKSIQQERKAWYSLYKVLQKNIKIKSKYLNLIDLSDDAFEQAREESERDGISIPEVLTRWIESGRNTTY
jgi:hypothetical protein